ncbi:helix-turn-helix domain-containing protein [Enterococcus rivorum]|uniref:Transcriptional regulator n=1 Tax=Enterococcus rivorum TaxID=762845 RepID=A0A1E5KZ67_9ENTE|nr:helix-turn-helix transcriptional regulator [Enterococcus rivorum]MBP2097663.1 transcriptional regulator with XRE-family HTH domain [Enterococcus rivorum]OEH83103.1 transcriptional regulator [Enterococcus rivorum]
MNIGDKIKEQRLRKELTQNQLAQLLNVSRSTVSSWEVGRNYPDLDTIVSISDLFNISLDHLLREDKEMTKSVSKKMKMNKYYKIILIVIGTVFIIYFGFNTKLRIDENRYRNNLEYYGWENNVVAPINLEDGNGYELKEGKVVYWTYILPAGLIGFPMSEQNVNVIANDDNYIVNVEGENDFSISVLHGNDESIDFDISVKVDQEGQLLESKASGSRKKQKLIKDYLEKYKEKHVSLIEKAIEKRREIIGRSQK